MVGNCLFLLTAILEKMRYQRLNSSTFRVSWVGSKGDTNVNETYIVTCKLNEEENCSMSSITVSDNEYHVNVSVKLL